ncbi:MOSC domain-containing protein YiiM [Devosia lucknowensis]|uniref:MOSC domain-containing protein YiiM n=1 Tax=Devosia lucknowensis TaxID=1096929 RepID=A0A1Y6GA51_9HYPH|nr:MOSC domain-containing protein [Devosia lucknowensis]SMQ86263.1 MOSC domain-containing protein YiiM [Devosia lucknowensis]
MSNGELIAVCVGKAEHLPNFRPLTGINKRPVAGPVMIGAMGIENDAILDRKHHGGRDQAIYVYFQDDYDWWTTQGITPAPGLFGENLVISGAASASTAIGDRFSIGDAVLEVTYHRTPCMTFSAKMGDKFWVKRFHKANRPGAYCRVLQPGAVTAGDAVAVTPYPGERITVSDLMAFDVTKDIPLDFMRRALTTPIREKTRFKYETRLADLF